MLQTKSILSPVVLGLVLLGAIFLLWSTDHERVREVSSIRHSAVTGAPQAPSGNGSDGRLMDASYYGHELEGSPTASGQPFDPEKYTAASKTLPLGTKLKVSHGGESVRVTVNDRGPYVPGRDLDLSLAAAKKIGLTGQAEAPVRVVVL